MQSNVTKASKILLGDNIARLSTWVKSGDVTHFDAGMIAPTSLGSGLTISNGLLLAKGVAQSTLTGSIQTTASVNVVGVGTLFTTELKSGDRIKVKVQTRTVLSITDDLNLVVDSAFSAQANDTAPQKLPSSFVVYNSSGYPGFMIYSDNSPYILSGVADGSTALGGEFDTVNALTGGSLFQFRNQEVTKFQINFDGSLAATILRTSPSIATTAINFASTLSGTSAGNTNTGLVSQITLSSLTGNWTNTVISGKFGITATLTGANYNVFNMTGLQSVVSANGSIGNTSTISNATSLLINGSFSNVGTVATYIGINHNFTFTSTGVTNYTGAFFKAAPTATTARGIYLNGNGTGNDLVLGNSAQNQIYCEVTTGNLVLNPKLSGTGTVLLLGNLTMNANNIISDAVTGTQIGTANTQKLGFWGVTPIVQLTNAMTAATFVSNTSNIADDSATWDGYTVGQVVLALRSMGLIA